MSLDIVEIALNSMTDDVEFEQLASEVMREEGYHDIKPLGGVHDDGQDAFQDRFYYREGRVKTVFQYTLEDYIERKLRRTIARLNEQRVDFSVLVIVTPTVLSSERQINLKKLAREEYDTTLDIYERKTLVNRLSNFSNGVFYRHFPSIEKQIEALRSNRPVLEHGHGELEMAMLKVLIAFVFAKEVDPVRKSIFDGLVLASLIYVPVGAHLAISEISLILSESLGCQPFPNEQIVAALRRLELQGFVSTEDGRYHLTESASITSRLCITSRF